jgi:hypothetical protein
MAKSKTDQEGQSRQIAIPHGRNAICPVNALDQWLELSGITKGPVFRPLTRRGHVLPGHLSGDSIASIVKQRVRAIGLDPTLYSGHAGFVTSAATAGTPAIKVQTGHASDALVGRYTSGLLAATSFATSQTRVTRPASRLPPDISTNHISDEPPSWTLFFMFFGNALMKPK